MPKEHNIIELFIRICFLYTIKYKKTISLVYLFNFDEKTSQPFFSYLPFLL